MIVMVVGVANDSIDNDDLDGGAYLDALLGISPSVEGDGALVGANRCQDDDMRCLVLAT
jgi:hypothetical protein